MEAISEIFGRLREYALLPKKITGSKFNESKSAPIIKQKH